MSFFIRQIKIESEEALYDHFVEHHPYTSFFQTRAWGDFQKQIPGRSKTWIFGLFEDKKIVGTMLVVRHDLPLGKCWLYTPRGPLLDWKNEGLVRACAAQIAQLAHQEKALFWRVDPLIPTTDPILSYVQSALKTIHARPAHASFQPEHTRILDLTQSEEVILSQMKQKGRYNIKLAAKKGVTVSESKDVTLFTKMMTETSVRDGFSVHAAHTYKALLNVFTKNPHAKLFIAKTTDGTPLAAAIILFYTQTATYLYGASTSQNRHLMGPYLLHWEIMRTAKADGYTYYDFFGIAPENTLKHPWRGVTEFKEKFGGTVKTYMPSHEIIYRKFTYLILVALKAVRSLVRH